MRTDIVRMYKDVHTWVGIVSGLMLFIAFYAGAITMFEVPLQRWASVPPVVETVPPLDRTAELVERVIAAHPKAAARYQIVLETSPENPARMTWSTRPEGADEHAAPTVYYAGLDADGNPVVTTTGPSGVAQIIDILHQQVGLPFDHEIAMPIMGVVALLYAIALVSGVIILLPSLVKDLFLLRVGRNLKRMWLDVHNVLGLFSLPFHIIMALTAVVFAFHDQFYDMQAATLYRGDKEKMFTEDEEHAAPAAGVQLMAPGALVARLAEQAPGFEPMVLQYFKVRGREFYEMRVTGDDPRHGLRGPTFGVAGVDPYTGEIVSKDYMPGQQDGMFATITSFFALHFGNFGSTPVRWGYFLMGLAGAFLFYSGNLLWIESRRKKARGKGEVEQRRATRVLGSLTVGVSLGAVAGMSLTIAAAKWLPALVASPADWHWGLYYLVFFGGVGWAFLRGAAKAGVELLWLSAVTTLAIPLTSLIAGLVPGMGGWNHADLAARTVDLTALLGAAAFVLMARRASRRVADGPTDSVWSAPEPAEA